MRNTYLFSVRRVLFIHVTVSGVLLVLLIGFWGFSWLKGAFNPPDLNHLLIVDRSNQSFEPPCTLVLNGEVSWEQRLDQFGGGGASPDGRVNIINIERAWFDGDFILKDGAGRILAKGEIRPIGRYCGTLVVVLLPNGDSQIAFNSLPDSPKE